jgi:hypothetical protein
MLNIGAAVPRNLGRVDQLGTPSSKEIMRRIARASADMADIGENGDVSWLTGAELSQLSDSTKQSRNHSGPTPSRPL